jgi:ElaB/YqjD/DUF883 family membrane-anchored ribosome-binding protein
VGEGTAQATRREVELTRQALAEDVDRFARKLRAELDWKARLRRDGPQIIAIAGAIGLVLVGVLVLRHRLRAGVNEEEAAEAAATVEDIARELRALREDVEKRLNGHGGLLPKVAVAAAGSVATAAGKVAAGRLLDKVEAERRETPVGSHGL